MSVSYGPYRLEIFGQLHLLTPMSIGTGERLSLLTDSPALRLGNLPNGRIFIPGSSLRGVLKHRLDREKTQIAIADKFYRSLFGFASQSENQGQLGRLRVHDSLPAHEKDISQVRDHVRHDLRTGASADGAKFDREVILPNSAIFGLRLRYYGESPDDEELLLIHAMVSLLQDAKVSVGGKQGGQLLLNGVSHTAFDRSDVSDLAAFASRRIQAFDQHPRTEGLPAQPTSTAVYQASGNELEPESTIRLSVSLQFEGPVLVKDGVATRVEGQPASDSVPVTRADSKRPYLPKESLRGVLRRQAMWLSSDANLLLRDSVVRLLGVAKQSGGAERMGDFFVHDGALDGDPRYVFLDHVAVDRVTGGVDGSKKFDSLSLDSPRFNSVLGMRFTSKNVEDVTVFLYLLRDIMEGHIQVGAKQSAGFGRIAYAAITELTLDLANDIEFQPADDTYVVSDWNKRRVLKRASPTWQDLRRLGSLQKRTGATS